MNTAISSPDAANLPVDQYMTAVGQ
ncbi:MAG: hypothetical protein RLZZ369_2442, partial [Pseudomonadota bacterium]